MIKNKNIPQVANTDGASVLGPSTEGLIKKSLQHIARLRKSYEQAMHQAKKAEQGKAPMPECPRINLTRQGFALGADSADSVTCELLDEEGRLGAPRFLDVLGWLHEEFERQLLEMWERCGAGEEELMEHVERCWLKAMAEVEKGGDCTILHWPPRRFRAPSQRMRDLSRRRKFMVGFLNSSNGQNGIPPRLKRAANEAWKLAMPHLRAKSEDEARDEGRLMSSYRERLLGRRYAERQ
jgi:hypothetical protein